MSIHIGVVVPTWHYWMNPLKLQPLWELYYATVLADKMPEAEVGVIDLREPETRNDGYRIPERDVYVYWINKSADAFEIYDIVKATKALYPRSIHVAGGTHVDHLTDQAAQHLDIVLTGTAEEPMVAAIRDHMAGKAERIYRSPERYHFCKYPMIRRDFIPAHRVVNTEHFAHHGGVVGTGAYFSRGCSFKCNFCVYNNPSKFEYRTSQQITEEIEYLKKNYGIGGVNLRDEVCIPVNPKEAIPYLEGIGRSGIIWRGQSVPLGSEELVKLAAESGLKEVALGLESVDSDKVLEISNKPSKSIESNKRYIELLRKYDIKVKVCLIFGLPGESKYVVDRTISFLEEVRPDYVAVSGFDPVPGSPFFRDYKRYGIKYVDEDLSKHAHLVYRFGDEEDVGLPFEYEADTEWGPSLTRQEIIDNIRQVQHYLRERSMVY